jgi:hypothetical protein
MFENKPIQPKKKFEPNFSEGTKVYHAKFGVGVIIKKLGRDVFTVNFEDHGTIDVHYDFLRPSH